MPRAALILGAVLGALATASVASASNQLALNGSGGALFTAALPWSNVHAKKEKGGLGKTVAIGHSVLAVEVADDNEYSGLTDLVDAKHRTASAHAKFLATSHKGWRLASVGGGHRFEVFSGKKVLHYIVYAAEAPSPETFHIRLVKDGGDGQKLMRLVDHDATRFWLGSQDPKTIANDANGLSLLQQVNQAVSGTQQVTFDVAPEGGTPEAKSQSVRADGYDATFDANGSLTEWVKGTSVYDVSDQNCWDLTTLDKPFDPFWSAPFLPTGLYALRVGPPKQSGSTVELDLSGFDSNSSQPDTIVVTADATTHLPVSEHLQVSLLGFPIAVAETFDWETPVVEAPQPGPACPS
jgi:hypothetical protein